MPHKECCVQFLSYIDKVKSFQKQGDQNDEWSIKGNIFMSSLQNQGYLDGTDTERALSCFSVFEGHSW